MRLIIFDFDGVVADSEWLSNKNLAGGLSSIGLATTVKDAMRLYMGRRWPDCVRLIEERLGSPLPQAFLDAQIARHGRLVTEVKAVTGIDDFLQEFAEIARCIASSSTLDHIDKCLVAMKLAPWFEHCFSGHDVQRGKPYPDLFLKAAAVMGASPAECIVIEDSVLGVMAGKAAGMLTLGLCAGSHIRDGHAERLRQAGADAVTASYAEIAHLLDQLIT